MNTYPQSLTLHQSFQRGQGDLRLSYHYKLPYSVPETSLLLLSVLRYCSVLFPHDIDGLPLAISPLTLLQYTFLTILSSDIIFIHQSQSGIYLLGVQSQGVSYVGRTSQPMGSHQSWARAETGPQLSVNGFSSNFRRQNLHRTNLRGTHLPMRELVCDGQFSCCSF